MSGFWIWQGSQYVRNTQGSKYATICLSISEFTMLDSFLNMSYAIHSARSLTEYLLRNRRIQNPVRDLRWSAMGK